MMDFSNEAESSPAHEGVYVLPFQTILNHIISFTITLVYRITWLRAKA